MATRSNCGTEVKGEFCPNCGTSIIEVPVRKKGKLARKAIIIIALMAVLFTSASCGGARTVNKPCDWCGSSPSVAYKVSASTGRSEAYVCKDCSTHCAYCGDKATKHYETMIGAVVFVCSDCYKEVQSY